MLKVVLAIINGVRKNERSICNIQIKDRALFIGIVMEDLILIKETKIFEVG